MKEQRTHGFSAVVTVCVLSVLTIVAWLYKIGKHQELAALHAEPARVESPEPQAQLPAAPRQRTFVSAVQNGASGWEYEALMGCQLVESRANDGNTFRIRHRDKEHVFRLYFVSAPETNLSHPDRIREQTRYFNYITEEQLLETGTEAREFALKLLRERPFTVFTRWEKLLQSHRYYGMIQVELEAGERRFLSELLANRGYVSLDASGRKLPNGVSEDAYRQHLRELEVLAQRSTVGGWRGPASQ